MDKEKTMKNSEIKYRVNEQGMIVEEIYELDANEPNKEAKSAYLKENGATKKAATKP
jgi:hypothetical protein